MSTITKYCPLTQKKQTPPPPLVPVPAKVPCPRDQKAYRLHLEKHSQRWIADKLKCCQPTVLRGIRRMEKWLATTLPEDRGEYTATEKLRLALAKHELLMERVLKVSLREFGRSRKTIPMKKTITTTDTTNEQGQKVKIRVEEWDKPQIGRKGFIDAAAKASHEITVLAAGWLGPGSGSISMAEVMDPEERDRWDRIVRTQDVQIEKLKERAQLDAGRRASPTDVTAGLGGERGDLQTGGAAGSETRVQQQAEPTIRIEQTVAVSKVDEKKPALNQLTDLHVVATHSEPTACVTTENRPPRKETSCKTCIKEHARTGARPSGSEEQAQEEPVVGNPCEREPRGRGLSG